MLVIQKYAIALFVDRSTQQWIVRDPEGNFWVLPIGDDAWQRREPFELTEASDLEPIPGHYKHLLHLPF